MNIYKEKEDNNNIIAYYNLRSKTNLHDAAWNLAVGQSLGNPNVRNPMETQKLYDDHCVKIIADKEDLIYKHEGVVCLEFPAANINWSEDGISQLLCMLMGGQLDINIIKKCQLVDLNLPFTKVQPKIGISGFRKYVNRYDKPLLGGIVKPKTGINKHQLLDIVKQMVDGGVDFIKEDEILGNPVCCPFEERVSLICNYLLRLTNRPIYCFCINSDYPYCIERAKTVSNYGGNGIHINFWSGFGVYKTLRELDLPLFLHFQKSGDKILTNEKHDFYINWNVICYLASFMGIDSIHAGMIGGYYKDGLSKHCLSHLYNNNIVPALSCGFHPGLVESVEREIGTQFMANVGGAIHGHPGGIKAGVLAMRQAIDKTYGVEYNQAIELWGKI